MLTPELMRTSMETYLRAVTAGDVEAVLALMSEDVSVEDPVGGPAGTHVVGLDAVGPFFRAGFARARPRPKPVGPICTTAGNEAAMSFELRLTLGDHDYDVDVVDVMTFDAAGKISRLRAFWNGAEMRRVG